MKKSYAICLLFFLLKMSCPLTKPNISPNQYIMNLPLHSKLQFSLSEGIWVNMIITNNQKKAVEFPKPFNIVPFDTWSYSIEAYHIAVLQSFHFIKIRLAKEDNIVINQREGLSTPFDHPFMNTYLQPQEELVLKIPLHEYYELEYGKTYTLSVQYGRDSILTQAKESFTLDE